MALRFTTNKKGLFLAQYFKQNQRFFWQNIFQNNIIAQYTKYVDKHFEI